MSRRAQRIRGFTLVELVVVASIVAVGLALAAPAVARARADARSDACRNNLKAIALAMHNYHDVFRAFPPGWVVKDVKPATGPCFSWGIMLAPFLDEAALYNRINFHQPPDLAESADLQAVIKFYRCPADTSEDVNAVRGEFGTSNYSGNYGDIALPGSVNAETKAHGVFFWNSKIGMADIGDGTSNTFAVGERCITSAAGIWPAVRSNQNAGDAVTACNHRARLNTVIDSFSSRHDGGAHFALCDGAVRFINNDIDSQEGGDAPKGTYQKLGHRSDGQQVGDF